MSSSPMAWPCIGKQQRRRSQQGLSLLSLLALSIMNHPLHYCCFSLQQRCIIRHGRSTTSSSPLWRRIHHHTRASSNNSKESVITTTLSAQRERQIIGTTTATEQLNLTISAEETARQKRSGQAKARIEKAARRENRISQLEIMDDGINSNGLSDSERAELEGLLRTRENFEEQYDADTFSAEHVEFKRLHNEAFVALARFCQQDRNRRSATAYAADNNNTCPNVFYLDGPDTATSVALIEKHGFDPSCCYVANRHLSTVKILQQHLPEGNVLHATAAEALAPPASGSNNNNVSNEDVASFSDVDFSAYYFDGCGGFTPHIVGMMSAALVSSEASSIISPAKVRASNPPKTTTAIGYSLMGGNKDVIEKELKINRALSNIARTRGMRTRHVLDDPWRYGVPAEIAKTEGGTFTSWILLEEEEEV